MPTSKLRAQIFIDGATVAEEMLREIGRRAYHTEPLTAELVGYLAEISKERVERADYLPLTPGTVARKNAQGEDTSILRDEWRPVKGTPTRQGDKLYRALTVSGAQGQLRRATRTTAKFGVNSKGQGELFYARFVQNVHGRKRRILAISEGQATVITMKAMSYIVAGSTKYAYSKRSTHPIWGTSL